MVLITSMRGKNSMALFSLRPHQSDDKSSSENNKENTCDLFVTRLTNCLANY